MFSWFTQTAESADEQATDAPVEKHSETKQIVRCVISLVRLDTYSNTRQFTVEYAPETWRKVAQERGEEASDDFENLPYGAPAFKGLYDWFLNETTPTFELQYRQGVLLLSRASVAAIDITTVPAP